MKTQQQKPYIKRPPQIPAAGFPVGTPRWGVGEAAWGSADNSLKKKSLDLGVLGEVGGGLCTEGGRGVTHGPPPGPGVQRTGCHAAAAGPAGTGTAGTGAGSGRWHGSPGARNLPLPRPPRAGPAAGSWPWPRPRTMSGLWHSCSCKGYGWQSPKGAMPVRGEPPIPPSASAGLTSGGPWEWAACSQGRTAREQETVLER